MSSHRELASQLPANGYQLLSIVFLISRVIWIKKVKTVSDEKKLLKTFGKVNELDFPALEDIRIGR